MLQLHVDAGTMPAASTWATRAATDGVGVGVAAGAEAGTLPAGLVVFVGAATVGVDTGLEVGAGVVVDVVG
jgi:hypothetical protein